MDWIELAKGAGYLGGGIFATVRAYVALEGWKEKRAEKRRKQEEEESDQPYREWLDWAFAEIFAGRGTPNLNVDPDDWVFAHRAIREGRLAPGFMACTVRMPDAPNVAGAGIGDPFAFR